MDSPVALLDLEATTRFETISHDDDHSSFRLVMDESVAGFPGMAFGGYLNAIAMRAAGDHSRFDEPVSMSMANLGFADLTRPVEVEVTSLRRSSRSETVEIHCHQGRPVFRSTIWMAVPGIQPAEQRLPFPDAVHHRDLQTDTARFLANGRTDMPTTFRFSDWKTVGERGTTVLRWFRVAHSPSNPPVIDAARALIAVDANPYVALKVANGTPWVGVEEFPWAAPTIDVFAHFHTRAPESDWLLAETTSEIVAGRVSATTRVFAEDGPLVCTGMSQGLVRRMDL